MKRSARHPFGGSRSYLRSADERRPRRRPSHQPRLRPRRFSVGALLEPPPPGESRPGVRLRATGLLVGALFGAAGGTLFQLSKRTMKADTHV